MKKIDCPISEIAFPIFLIGLRIENRRKPQRVIGFSFDNFLKVVKALILAIPDKNRQVGNLWY